jgi:antitoxin component YwqK of YwqJK toxin-antitoxin module
MVDSHSKSFFGQNTGMIVSSSSSSDPFIFIHCIKKKPDGIWEKPSINEGKVIKISLEEIVMILRVLNRQTLNWQSHHIYKEKKTSLSFSWEDEDTNILWINIGIYSKMLNLAQAEILRLLLIHLLREKIFYSTIPKRTSNENKTVKLKQEELYNKNKIEEINEESDCYKSGLFPDIALRGDLLKDLSNVNGIILGETEKAILIEFDNKEIWVPKSTINNHYHPRKNLLQKFLINNWFLKKNNLAP